MMARLLKDGDERLDEISDFEIQKIGENGEIQDTDWEVNSTFNKVFDKLEKKHRKGFGASVLDYGDELQATVTPDAKSVKHHYRILMT